MAVIKFNDADRLASVIVPTDWYRAEITELEGPKQSTSEKSFNFFVKMQLIGDKFTGKELGFVFNTKTKSPSLLGQMQFFPHAWMIPLAAAIMNVSVDQVPMELDTDTLLRKPFDLKVEKGIHEGVPMNTILAFLPDGKGADAGKSPF